MPPLQTCTRGGLRTLSHYLLHCPHTAPQSHVVGLFCPYKSYSRSLLPLYYRIPPHRSNPKSLQRTQTAPIPRLLMRLRLPQKRPTICRIGAKETYYMILWGYGIQFPKRTKSTRPGKVSTTGVNVYQCSGSSIGEREREREFSDNGHHLFIEFVPAGAIIDACINPLRTCVCV